MKYKMFRNLMVGSGVVAVVAGGASMALMGQRKGGDAGDGAGVEKPVQGSSALVKEAKPDEEEVKGGKPALGDKEAQEVKVGVGDKAGSGAGVQAVEGVTLKGAGGGSGGGGGGDGAGMRPVDEVVMGLLERKGSDKVKDPYPDKPYKIEVKRTGPAEVRVKLDLDRDGKWDEKWTVTSGAKGTGVKRHVAPADDESYSETYDLVRGVWKKR